MAAADAKTLEIILKLTDQLTGDLKKAKEQIKSLEDDLKNTSSAGDKLTSSIKAIAQVAGIAFLAKQVYDVGKSIVETTGNFEQWNIAFSVMLGSSGKAKTLMEDIKKFAAETPFELPQVVEGSKRLLAYNVAAGDIIPTFTVLGNIAAGVGTEKLPQLITAFGQVSAKGKLMGQELLQFTEAGVNLGGELQKAFGVSRSALELMVSSGKVGFEDVRKALFNLGGETGKFGGLMDAQSKTIQGVWSNIKDTITQAFLAIGNAALPQMRAVVNFVLERLSEVKIWLESNKAVLESVFVNMAQKIAEVGKFLLQLGGFFYKYLIGPVGEALKQPLGQWIAGIIAGVYALSVAFTALAAVNPLGWIAIGVAAGIIAFNYLRDHWDQIVGFFKESIQKTKDWFTEFFKHVADIASRIGTIFMDAGNLIFQAMTGKFGEIKASFAQLQKDLGSGISFSVSSTNETKNVTSNSTTNTTSNVSTSTATADTGMADFENALKRKAEIQKNADAEAQARLEANNAKELETKRAHTTTLIAEIEANNLVDIDRETKKIAALTLLRGVNGIDQVKLEQAIANSKNQIQIARNAQETGAASKQLKELMKLRGKDGIDQTVLEQQIAETKDAVIMEYHANVILMQQRENEMKQKLIVRGLQDGLGALEDILSLGAEKYKAAAIALKVVRTAEAVINTYAGATAALASTPYPWNLVAMASVIASGLVQVAKINEVQFATGAVSVPGTGNRDTVAAKLTPGEMVVPQTFAEGIRSGDLSLSKTSSVSQGEATNIFVTVSMEGANFYGAPSYEWIKDIFNKAADSIRAGLIPALPVRG